MYHRCYTLNNEASSEKGKRKEKILKIPWAMGNKYKDKFYYCSQKKINISMTQNKMRIAIMKQNIHLCILYAIGQLWNE